MKLIPLINGGSAIVDDGDFDFISRFRWRNFKGYAAASVSSPVERTKHLSMHRLILDAPRHLQVDHKNGNSLDNRRSNLRNCTASENRQNQRLRSDNSTGFKGVTFKKSAGKFMARIGVPGEGRSKHLGYFKQPHDAFAAYCKAAGVMYKQFARPDCACFHLSAGNLTF